MSWSHCIRAAVVLPTLLAADHGERRIPGTNRYPDAILCKLPHYVRSAQIGRESVTLTPTSEGWTLATTGVTAPPIDLVARDLRIKYTRDWKPVDLTFDATVRGENVTGRTTVAGSTASSVFTEGGRSTERSSTIGAGAVFLPSPLWTPFEALAQRLRSITAGTTIPAFALQAPFEIQVGASQADLFQTASRSIPSRKTAIKLVDGQGLDVDIWTDASDHLLRISVPAQGVEVLREDIASVAVRHVAVSRPGDEEIRVPALGFSLAGTLSKPLNSSGRLPAVVLVGSSGPSDRDETLSGIPVFGQLASALADAGFLVVRYDKRGVGQSGGRPESAGIDDFSSDLRAVVDFLRKRKDVDRKRIALVGHGEGGPVAMTAAAQEDDVAAVVLVSAMASTGAELNMWQVEHSLDRLNTPTEKKRETLDLQKRIQSAVLTGAGWDAIPAHLRRQADTAWFKSLLLFNPEVVLKKMKQPVLVLHGTLDTEVPPANADRFEAIAGRLKDRKRPVDVVRVAGINHLLVAATTGESTEYAALRNTAVSPAVSGALAAWLHKALPPPR